MRCRSVGVLPTAVMFIATNGEVTRPGVGEPNAMVSLTATLSKAGATDVTKTFELTVLAEVASAQDQVDAASSALMIGYAEGETNTNVTQDVTLSTSGSNEVSIRWSSSDSNVIATNGEVTRPDFGDPNATVTLTATLSKTGATDVTKTFMLTVLAHPASAQDQVDAASNALMIGYAAGETNTNVTQDVTLSTSGSNEVAIRWSSSSNEIIATNGGVTRPAIGESDATVSLTATLSKAGATDVMKIFMLTVLAEVAGAQDQVNVASNTLMIGYAGTDSASSVTTNVILPTNGADEVSISWSSSDEMVISIAGTNGEVTRPNFSDGDATVTLTATLSKTGATDVMKIFELMVLKLPNPDIAAVEMASNALAIGYAAGDSENSVTKDVTLPTSGADEVSISWSSSNEMVISIDGTNGEVTRPAFAQGTTNVSLTATLFKGMVTNTKIFELTVLALPDPDIAAVEMASNALAIGYTAGDSESSVTTNVMLSTNGANGVSISWSSSDEMVISIDGTTGEVTRPEFGQPNTNVSLTARLFKGMVTNTNTYTLTVLAITSQEQVDAASNALMITYAAGDSESSVTKDVTLPTSGADGVSISWSSSAVMFISTTGEVTRPEFGQPNTNVSLTATLSKAGATTTKTFELTVLALPDPDIATVEMASNALAIGYATGETNTNVTQNVTLPTSGADGVSIRWSSTDSDVIATNGEVTRPDFGQSDANVSLTATLSKADATTTKTFELTVLAEMVSAQDQVEAASNALLIGYATGETNTNVTQNVTLPTSGADGVAIRWSSTDSDVIVTNGEVIRPDFRDPNAMVSLTATLSKAGATTTKTFELTVLAEVASAQDQVDAASNALMIGYATGETNTNVTQNVTLSTSGSNGVAIRWSSTDSNVIATNGEVTRPDFGDPNAMVSLTATLSKAGATATKTFTLTVLTGEAVLGRDWKKVANSAALDRYGHAVFAYHNELFVVAGRRDRDTLNTVFGSTNDGLTWNSKANIDTRVDASSYDLSASVFHRGSMYLIGGRPNQRGAVVFNGLYRSKPRNATNADGFALNTLNWQLRQPTMSPLPFGRRYGMSAVSFQDTVWIMGGIQNLFLEQGLTVIRATTNRNNDVLRVDNSVTPGDRYWTNVPAMNHFSARNNHRSVTFAGKIWVIGGHDGTNFLQRCVEQFGWHQLEYDKRTLFPLEKAMA